MEDKLKALEASVARLTWELENLSKVTRKLVDAACETKKPSGEGGLGESSLEKIKRLAREAQMEKEASKDFMYRAAYIPGVKNRYGAIDGPEQSVPASQQSQLAWPYLSQSPSGAV